MMQPTTLPPVETDFAFIHNLDARWHWLAQVHDYSELSVVLSGNIRVEVDGNSFNADPGSVLMYPAGLVHSEWIIGSAPVRLLYMRCLVRETALVAHMPPVLRDARGRVETMFNWIIATAEVSDDHALELRNLWAEGCFRELRLGHFHKVPPLLAIVNAYLRENIDKRITTAELAEAAHLSRSHFNRQFRCVSDMSPASYLRHRRIELACRLLRDSDMKVRSIAASVGFEDPFHFSRTFRAVVGSSPAHFRRKNR